MRKDSLMPVLAILFLVDFIVSLNMTIVNVALPAMAVDLSITASKSSWITFVYVLGISSLILPLSKFAGNNRVRRFLIAGSLMFILSTVMCSLSGSFEMLAVSRLLQGIAAAMVLCTISPLILCMLPPDKRGLGVSVMGGSTGLALVVGPVVGGCIVDVLSWKWIFLVNVPIAVVLLFTSLLLPKDGIPVKASDPTPLGSLSSLVFFGSLMGLSEDIGEHDLSVMMKIVFAVTAVISGIVFLRVIKRDSQRAVIRPRRLFNRDYLMLGIAFLLCTMITGGMNYMLPFLMQYTWSMTSMECGLYMAIASVATISVVLSVGRWCDRRGAKVPSLMTVALRTIFCLLGLILVPQYGIVILVIALIIFGIGNAFSGTAHPAGMIHHSTPGMEKEATTLMSNVNYFATALGCSVFAMLFSIGTGGTFDTGLVADAFGLVSVFSLILLIPAAVLTAAVMNRVPEQQDG